jgi:hypothetical protein
MFPDSEHRGSRTLTKMARRGFASGLTFLALVLGVGASADGSHFRGTGLSRLTSRALAPTMERTPAYVLAYCRKSRWLPLACPRLLPRMEQPMPHWEVTLCGVGTAGCQGLAWDDLNLVDAGNGHRPPIWSHISIYAGNLTSAFRFQYPANGPRPSHLDGLFARTTTRAIFVGSFTWGGRHGTVVLAPDYPAGGEQGGHLIFRWHQSGVEYALGLHAWEPLSEMFATLKAMVASI